MAIFNMVGGGGGLSATDAILRVIAPAGSVVTISKGVVSKSDQGHENASDNTLYDYYFIIHASQFDNVNPWTVTATLGTQSISESITIASANEYDVVISYTLHLVINGVMQDGNFVPMALKSTSDSSSTAGTPSVSSGSNYIQIGMSASSGFQTGIAYLPNKYDLSKYSKVRVTGTAMNSFDTSAGFLNLSLDAWTSFGSYQTDNRLIQSQVFTAQRSSYTSIDMTVDISSLSNVAYVGFNFGKSSSQATGIRIANMWLEA